MNSDSSRSNTLQLVLGTGAFALCFAVFGSVSAMMPVLKKQFHLAPLQASIAMAIPVLLGSLGRIPLGLLADRFGGRKVFTWTMVASVIAALLMGKVETYSQLLLFGFFTGIALASFSVGVAFVSGWYLPEKQGFALGVYGAGNVGQSLAAFGAPLLFTYTGFRNTFWSFAVLLAAWCLLFVLFAKDAPRTAAPKSFMQMVRPLSEKMSWILSFFYFLTFGGFVAMSIYLPMFLTELFKLTPQDAGLRTAGFVLLATLMRPVGGWLSDKVGGLTILLWIFPFVTAMALLMTLQTMVPFTIGALGMAAVIGLGNGAVFKLVPQYFPQSVGAVTGLVGAMGGLGGFFPPLALGIIRQQTGSFVWGFGLLALFALLCLAVAKITTRQQFKQQILKQLKHREMKMLSQRDIYFGSAEWQKFRSNSLIRTETTGRDVTHATIWGLSVAGALLLFIFIGSNGLKHYDAALVPYTGACVFSAFGIGYRFAMWLRRPPTRKYWFQGWRIFFRPASLPRNIFRLVQVFFSDFVEQRFIEKRSHTRWAAHWLIAWGCILAAAVTFPLSFGWVHFESAPDNQAVYRAFVFGQHVSTFHLGTVTAALTFNLLDVSAVMVLLGVALALFRRARDRGAISVQQFAQDMMPLLMLFAISITGLFLTASTHLLHGLNYGFLSMLHAVTVIFTLLYLPFGKFFHIFQRPAQIGVQFYKEEGARSEQARCLRCGEPFASRMHIDDLKDVQNSLGIQYQLPAGGHYQDVCPSCRRKSLAIAQDGKWREQGTRSVASEPTRGIWPNHQ